MMLIDILIDILFDYITYDGLDGIYEHESIKNMNFLYVSDFSSTKWLNLYVISYWLPSMVT